MMRKGFVLTLIIVLLCLTACSINGPEHHAAVSDGITTENVQCGDLILNQGVIGVDSKGVYSVKNGVVYISLLEDGNFVSTALCSKTGCSHRDSTCNAFIGSYQHVTYYRNMVYGISDNGDGSMELVELNCFDGTRRTVCVWKPQKDESYRFCSGIFFDGNLYMSYDNWNFNRSEDWVMTDCVHLESGEKYNLFADQDVSSHTVIGGFGNTLICEERYLTEKPKTYEEWIQGGGTDDGYEEYMNGIGSNVELVKYDIKDMAKTVIADQDRNKYIDYTDLYLKIENHELIYAADNEIHIYSLETGEDRMLAKKSNIRNYHLYDNKANIIVIENGKVQNITVDVNTLAELEIPHTKDNAVDFWTMYEFKDYCVGMLFDVAANCNRAVMLKKEDYYTGKYENAVGL